MIKIFYIKNVHNRENTEYECDFIGCIFKTKYKTNLVRHMKKIHFIDDEMRCPFKNENNCKYRTYFQKDLEKHIEKELKRWNNYELGDQWESGIPGFVWYRNELVLQNVS